MSQDYYNVFHQYFYPAGSTANVCDRVSAYRTYPTLGTDPDGYHYFYYNSGDYFEVAFVLNDTGAKTWQTLSSRSNIPLTLPSPYTMKSMRDTDSYFAVYLRVKGCTTEHKIRNISLKKIVAPYVTTSTSGCDQANLSFYIYSDYDGTICFPYEWRILNSDSSVFMDWQGPFFNRPTHTAANVPTGSPITIEFRDSEGYIWTRSITPSVPKPSLQRSASTSYSYKEPDGVYRSNVYLYLPTYSYFPVGTTFKYLSGPTPPINLTGTVNSSTSSSIYPYSPSITSGSYQRLDPGVYAFEVTRPGCTPDTLTGNHSVYKLESPPVYTLTEECDGLSVTFTGGGRMQMLNYNGTVSNSGTPYIRIGSAIPSSTPFDNTKVVTHGGSLKLPMAGTYIIYLGTSNNLTFTAVHRDTIVYSPTPFTLDHTVTSHYLCQGESIGFIRVKGTGGSGGYKYELYDKDVLKFTNTTGVFNYGMADSTYTIRLYDTICGTSYPQDVRLIDLGIAQIAYSSSPDNKFCLTDSIYLKCLTLGETTYTWTGPGITAANQNEQNPVIAASDIGMGTHVYTITVTPEACGTVMQRTVSVIVEDCEGARDDYHTMFANTTDSVNVLANDGYPSACGASVTPVITVNPAMGIASVVNNKVVYTPNADFIGKDSLTYRTTCESNITYAKVYITVIKIPDNIVDPDCWIEPEKNEWKIQLNQQLETVATTAPFVVGDMNDDGYPDIVAYGNSARSSIKIFWGPDFNSVKEITGVSGDSYTPIAIAKVKINDTPADQYEAFIFYRSNATSTLRAYRTDGTSPWLSNPDSRYQGMIGVADFNGDGWSEVYLGNQIYDAATGKLVCDGGTAENSGTTFTVLYNTAQPVAIDITGDSNLELVAGNKIYQVDIDRNTSVPKSLSLLSSVNPPSGCLNDGLTVVADFDNDGKTEVLVRRRDNNDNDTRPIHLYIWSPHTGTNTGEILANTTGTHRFFGVPFVGDIDGDKRPEIVTLGSNGMTNVTQSGFTAYRYNENTNALDVLWDMNHTDQSGATGMTLFDFNNDSISEIVYRDENNLRIINASGKSHVTGNDTIQPYAIESFVSYSETSFEYPVVADIYGNRSSAILVTSDLRGPRPNGFDGNAKIDIYTSDPSVPWAPARKVWNQYAYNAVNINEDLTIPRYPLNIATVFAGKDGMMGTTDDVRPYNNFLQQQTLINQNGVPIFPAPDAIPDQSISSGSLSGNSISITVGITNAGDAAIGAPVYVTIYKESVSDANKLATGSFNGFINPGETGYVTIQVPDITPHLPFIKVIARINDDGADFPYQPECDTYESVLEFINPALSLLMKKDATLEGVPGNGAYPNPVSVLYGEKIKYEITAVNANYLSGNVIVRDTLPAYLNYVENSATPSVTLDQTSNPEQDILIWTLSGLSSMASQTVSFEASPQEGASASQPMFINRAWITASDSLHIVTGNSTFHQGAGVGVVTFSAGSGGYIYNADPQAVDFRTTAQKGVIVVPEEGYAFTGWSHNDYTSLRGETVHAEEGIMYYDTLTIYGNVELTANFETEKYPVRYRMNGSINHAGNPPEYTIESGTITLETPEKADDVFTGWTGSNGNEPQMVVNIPKGSTGERVFFANFLHSGREDNLPEKESAKDQIWAAKDMLYIRTSTTGSIVRIYTTEGVLQEQRILISDGITGIKLLQGIYIVTLNNGTGHKVIIR
ncbi:MAG TPA: hypothetical protein DEQ30_11980 [Porphyromonadaceae bacterium]|nr:hypothetical protein [Porphyromonadaceae bacterium]